MYSTGRCQPPGQGVWLILSPRATQNIYVPCLEMYFQVLLGVVLVVTAAQ